MTSLAFVGCAHIHTPSFINALKGRTDVRVKSVWDHNSARAEKRAAELGAAVADANAIWDDPEIKGVVICSETNRHEPLVAAATQARKHLFVEKPLGMGAKDGYAMARQIEKSGVLFQTGYFQRSSPVNRFVKRQVEIGAFGKITRVRGSNCHDGSLGGWFDTEWRWMADPKLAGVGAFGDLGTHFLDLLIWFMGNVESCTGSIMPVTQRYGPCDETGEGLMKFSNGAIGTLAGAWVDRGNPMSLLVSGTEGYAAVINNELFFKSSNVAGADGKQAWTDLPPAAPNAIELFCDAVAGKAPAIPLVTAGEAAYRSAVMEAMYQGAEGSKWVKPITA